MNKLFKKTIKTIALLITPLILIIIGVIIYNSIPAGSIYLEKDEADLIENPELQTFSINAENLRYPYFGTAFHLHYNPEELQFTNYTLGNYFKDTYNPLTLVNEKDKGLIIVGISLKKGEIIEKSEGTFLKFHFKKLIKDKNLKKNKEEIDYSNLYFSNTVFTTYNNGRKDIPNVIFRTRTN